ncbi:MAG: thiamine diphosphokinase [Chloroflexota bacterium]|nr:thiamine diphosphokinase [Chloroflexota bacterium]
MLKKSANSDGKPATTPVSPPVGPTVVWVLAAGPMPNALQAAAMLPKADAVIAADGGLNLASALGIRPDLIVGDLDSADPVLLQRFIDQGVETRRYSHNTKLETDTELALLAALKLQAELQSGTARIYILGALGGRLDHGLANLLLLTDPEVAQHDVRIVDGYQEAYLAQPGVANLIAGKPGDTVSLLPLSAEVTEVYTVGLEYPLSGDTLYMGRGRGVSNVLVTQSASVRFATGLLLVVVIHVSQNPSEQ